MEKKECKWGCNCKCLWIWTLVLILILAGCWAALWTCMYKKVDNLHKPNKKTKQSSAGICRFPRFYGVYVPEIIKDAEGNITAVNRTFINFNDNKKTDQQNLETAEKYFFG